MVGVTESLAGKLVADGLVFVDKLVDWVGEEAEEVRLCEECGVLLIVEANDGMEDSDMLVVAEIDITVLLGESEGDREIVAERGIEIIGERATHGEAAGEVAGESDEEGDKRDGEGDKRDGELVGETEGEGFR